MHPDLSAHLHSDECNRLIQELFNCRAEVSERTNLSYFYIIRATNSAFVHFQL